MKYHFFRSVYFPSFIAFIISGLFLSCASTPMLKNDEIHDFKEADFIGIVYESNNLPSYGAEIQLDNKSKKIYRTDINGRFVIPRLKYGKHQIVVSKPGFENNNVDVSFTSRKQVLYVQLISIETLLDGAEKNIDNLEWYKAREFLLRAQRIDGGNSRLIGLEGALSYKTSDFATALRAWMKLIEKGHRDSYLYLIIADTYQFGLNEEKNAITWLEKHLEARDNEAVRNRLKQLKDK